MTVSLRSSPVALLTAGPGAEAELRHCSYAVRARGGEPVRLIQGATPPRQFLWRREADDLNLSVARVMSARPEYYAGLVLIGRGEAVSVQDDDQTLALINGFSKLGLPMAAAGYGPVYLAQAGLVRGRRLTSAPQLRDRLAAAGAQWVDEPVTQCPEGPNVLITCGSDPHSMPPFCDAFTRAFAARGLRGRDARLAGLKHG